MARSPAEVETRRPVALSGGMTATHIPANAKALVGAGYTFSTTFTLPYRGQTLTFEAGTFYQIDAPLLAFMAANGITPNAY